LTKRAIVKKEGGSSKDFENLSKKISKMSKKAGVDITYVSVSKSSSSQELWIRGEQNAIDSFMIQLANSGLLISEELLIPL
jgi:arabinogalactan endo-1,4-beta-galactosidase